MVGPNSKGSVVLKSPRPFGQKIEAVERIVPVRRSLVGRCAAIGMTQQRVAYLPIFVLDCRESHSQKQAQLKVGAFQPQRRLSSLSKSFAARERPFLKPQR